MIALGAAFVLVPVCIWPSVPLIVDPRCVGAAFGLMTAIQNLGLAVHPVANGTLRDATRGYTSSQIMFAVVGFCGLVCQHAWKVPWGVLSYALSWQIMCPWSMLVTQPGAAEGIQVGCLLR